MREGLITAAVLFPLVGLNHWWQLRQLRKHSRIRGRA